MAKPTKKRTPAAGRTVRAPRKRAAAKARESRPPESLDEAPSEDRDRPSGRDAFSRYLRDLGSAAPLLSKDEELALARRLFDRAACLIRERIAVARKLVAPKRRKSHPEIAAMAEAFLDEYAPRGLEGKRLENRLRKLLYDGNAGAERLMGFVEHDKEGAAIVRRFIESNLRLVINVAKRYGNGMLSIEELVQEGNIGLMHAVPRFDASRGFRFSTYATWWIRHAIGRAIADKGRTVRLPVHLIEMAHRIGKRRADLTAKLGRMPNDEELAKSLKLPVQKVSDMRRWTMTPVSIDEPVGDEREDPLVDFLSEKPEEPEPWTTLVPDKHLAILRDALDGLRGIEGDILRMRFGLDENPEMTLREIGDTYHLSRERIRQLEQRALAKLRMRLTRFDLAA